MLNIKEEYQALREEAVAAIAHIVGEVPYVEVPPCESVSQKAQHVLSEVVRKAPPTLRMRLAKQQQVLRDLLALNIAIRLLERRATVRG